MPQPLIRTIGHSTRPVDALIEMLQAHGVQRLIDVRTIPKSRYNPQYNSEALEQSLRAAGIAYGHIKALGGLRHPRKDSPNTAWRNQSFRGYADYMQTDQFRDALETLIEMGRQKRIAIMCAEAVPWRCHRSLVADALNARAVPAIEILSEKSYRAHKLTPFAQVDGMRVTYPPEQAKLL